MGWVWRIQGLWSSSGFKPRSGVKREGLVLLTWLLWSLSVGLWVDRSTGHAVVRVLHWHGVCLRLGRLHWLLLYRLGWLCVLLSWLLHWLGWLCVLLHGLCLWSGLLSEVLHWLLIDDLLLVGQRVLLSSGLFWSLIGLHLVHFGLEDAHGTPQGAGCIWQAGCSEENQNDKSNDYEIPATGERHTTPFEGVFPMLPAIFPGDLVEHWLLQRFI